MLVDKGGSMFKYLISILPKIHADGDKWLVTEITNFTSI